MEATFAMWSRRQFGWGPEQNGYLFAGIGVLSAAIQGGLVGRLARRFGEGALIVQGAAALAIGYPSNDSAKSRIAASSASASASCPDSTMPSRMLA